MRCRLLTLGLVLLAPAVGCSDLRSVSSRMATSARVSAELVRVVDGDTVEVRTAQGMNLDVRLLAIDSPEKYATRYGSPDECGSAAASHLLSRFEGDRVTLMVDATQDSRDRYGRLLRYVGLRGVGDLGALALRRGVVTPYQFRTPAQRYGRYLSLARDAQHARRGTWGPPCDGDFHSSLPGVQNGL